MSYLLYRTDFGVAVCKEIVHYTTTGLEARYNQNPLDPDAKYVFRWGTTSNLPGNPKVINTAKAIHRVYDKAAFRKVLSDAGLAPKSWFSWKEYQGEDGNISMNEQDWSNYPIKKVLVRPRHHSRSEDMVLCDNPDLVVEAAKRLGEGNYYISEFIDKTREFRVFFCQGRIAWVVEKHPEDKKSVSWGCVDDEDDSYFEYVAWSEIPMSLAENALKAAAHSKLDFGAVDVVMDKEGRAFTLEINTGPQVTPYYAKCICKCFDYIVTNGPGDIPVKDYSTWKNVMHPAIWSE